MLSSVKTEYPNLIYLNPNYLTILADAPRRKPEANELKNLEDNNSKTEISHSAKKRITKSIQWLNHLSPWRKVTNPTTGSLMNFKLNFITLTLSSKQIHTDLEIKSKLLNQFLTELRTNHNLKTYIWRAEAQENGNIHFHIITNQFILWSELRSTWNRIQEKLGYVSRYRDAQNNFHKNGFKLRKELLEKWDEKSQLKAYKEGAKSNWSNPNSVDVHKIEKVKNISAYVSKYMAKEKVTRSIAGRRWFISQNLSKLKPIEIEQTTEVMKELEEQRNIQNKEWTTEKYFSFLPIGVTSINQYTTPKIYSQILTELKQYQESIIKGTLIVRSVPGNSQIEGDSNQQNCPTAAISETKKATQTFLFFPNHFKPIQSWNQITSP